MVNAQGDTGNVVSARAWCLVWQGRLTWHGWLGVEPGHTVLAHVRRSCATRAWPTTTATAPQRRSCEDVHLPLCKPGRLCRVRAASLHHQRRREVGHATRSAKPTQHRAHTRENNAPAQPLNSTHACTQCAHTSCSPGEVVQARPADRGGHQESRRRAMREGGPKSVRGVRGGEAARRARGRGGAARHRSHRYVTGCCGGAAVLHACRRHKPT